MNDRTQSAPLDRDILLQMARDRAGLSDFGDCWFFELMDAFLEASNREGRLTPSGVSSTTEAIVKGLISRLRMVADMKRHPEIA